MKLILMIIAVFLVLHNSSQAHTISIQLLMNNLVIADTYNLDYSTEKLRSIGKQMSKTELLSLKKEMFDSVDTPGKEKEYYYLRDYAPISLVAGLYDKDFESLKDFINSAKERLINYTKKRGLNQRFDRENSEEGEFVKKYFLYNRLLSETVRYAKDNKDAQVFWKMIEDHHNIPFVNIRNQLILELKKWVETYEKLPVEKELGFRILKEIKATEEEYIKTTKDFKDFINSHASSKYIIQNITEILSKME